VNQIIFKNYMDVLYGIITVIALISAITFIVCGGVAHNLRIHGYKKDANKFGRIAYIVTIVFVSLVVLRLLLLFFAAIVLADG